MTTIIMDHVTKRFSQRRGSETRAVSAVEDVSLKVPSGTVLAILGPSGCGKTTLLRLAAGLEQPESGEIFYGDDLLQTIPLRERGIGMVFHDHALLPHWETRRTVSFFFTLRKRDEEVPERIKRISQITGIGLNMLLERRPRELSGGEKQRVAIARALTRDLRVLFFDEPFANLDAKLRAQARVELKRLLNEFATTAIYVTHDQVEAVALSHRIAIMREGRLEQIGSYHNLYTSPLNLFVATFVGTPTINLFRGHIEDGRWYGTNFGGFRVRSDLPDGAPVTLGVRPEHVEIAANGALATVQRVTPFLSERFLLVEVQGGGEEWSLAAPLEEQVSVGSTIGCSLDPRGLLYFNGETGVRIG